MLFTQTSLKDAYVIEPERVEDDRGYFARTWCQQEFADRGLDSELSQCNISFNHQQGTVRGMHLQLLPFAETKLVRCTHGAMYDVIVDLRPDSPTFQQWTAIDLTADNLKALYVPKGFAHGFQTLTDDTSVFYQMSGCYQPGFARGFRWNDPTFKIDWPLPVKVIADRDRDYPDYSAESFAPVVVVD